MEKMPDWWKSSSGAWRNVAFTSPPKGEVKGAYLGVHNITIVSGVSSWMAAP